MKRPIIIFTLLIIFHIIPTCAQPPKEYTYKHFGIADGMHSQRINSIQQTKDGALWWASKNGVERYNGVGIKFYNISNNSSFGNQAGHIFGMRYDNESDNLYVFDNKGYIYQYDHKEDCFVLKLELIKYIRGNIILNDMLASKGALWFSLRSGIYCYRNGQMSTIRDDLQANNIIKVGKRLVFCTEQGVFSMTEEGTGMAQFQNQTYISSSYYDEKYNKLWFGSFQNGVNVIDAKKTQQYAGNGSEGNEHPGQYVLVPNNPVRCFAPLDDNTMLIGIDGFGIYYTNRKNPKEAKLFLDANNGPQGQLHGNGIYAMLHDSFGNIIVGSYSGGIDIITPIRPTKSIFTHSYDNFLSLSNDHVNVVAQMPDGRLMMGTDNGISIFNPTTSEWHNIMKGSVVIDINITPSGSIYAATFGQGVYEIKNDQAYNIFTKENGLLKNNHIYSLCTDNKGNLWIGGLTSPLIERTPTGTNYYNVDNIKSIIQLPDGQMAIGTASGLFLVSSGKQKVTRLNYGEKIKGEYCQYVLDMSLCNGNLWIGTDGGGLYIYDFDSHTCKQITTKEGLPSNSICAICPDKRGRVWLATYNGLAYIEKDNTTKIVNTNYLHEINREYCDGSICLLKNGHIMLGSTSGCTIIDPDMINELNYKTKLRTFGFNNGKMKVSYNERTFDIHFEAINLQHQFDIGYQYKIGKQEWSEISNQQYIRFTNLEPGTHHLILRAVSISTGKVLDESKVTIVIASPWWKTWWMFCFYLIIVIAIFYGAWRVYDLHARYMQLMVTKAREFEVHPIAEASSAKATENAHEETSIENKEGEEFLGHVTQIIMGNISDSDFNIDSLCKEMAMSRTLFYVRLKSLTGKSPQDFVRVIRLERAASLLKQGKTVQEVAALTGFDNPKYFSTVFKKHFGCSPSKYQ